MDEAFHLVIRAWETHHGIRPFELALPRLEARLGKQGLHQLLLDFIQCFPPTPVFRGELAAKQYLGRRSGERTHRALAAEEALMLELSDFNPANERLRELFDRRCLPDGALFGRLMDELEAFFREQPGMGPDNVDVIRFLKTPVLLFPDDIGAQLRHVLEHWKEYLPESMRTLLLRGTDLIREDARRGGGGPGPALVPQYGPTGGRTREGHGGQAGSDTGPAGDEEYEHFTPDTHWMPRVVMMARNTYVWLDQLSKKYERPIRRLNEIPSQELDTLAASGFNGLWLIGIWERSSASRRIKHLTGNPDAASSAYSLYDYEIARDLGGEEAFRDLDHRSRERGIRLASDMVPNHTGLYSRWMVEHPEYFIQTRVPPFPAYRFTGENLSDHPDIDIRIEDGYYNRSDAAVVFRRHDLRLDDIRYIYHGNDGTHMPWNDTAQLDMLRQEVRQAVIGKIMEVAGRFSIIRFDAAMTLAKKHFARLWYPRPGSGGDIPSRADHAMSREAFDQWFPKEFWREVVDRINQEMPDTLLLAEAFWLMEGFFVRTLGMHRVYNSAFMHMLRDEENGKYRELITNTLEFEPEILKRYVNFMSNPDEETAIRQFGTGDKYFGVCTLMATLPGLPMFAHGQLEGYTEKYGMEYQRAYYNESPDSGLMERHQRDIFPLLRRRHLFSDVAHFWLFDYVTAQGTVNENVFAYTNRSGSESALVLFNNRYETAGGRIHHARPKRTKQDDDGPATSLSLGEALDLQAGQGHYYSCREQVSGLEFLRRGEDICRQGFHWDLQGFEYRVFLDFKRMEEDPGLLEELCRSLEGHGTGSLSRELDRLRYREVFDAFLALFHATEPSRNELAGLRERMKAFALKATVALAPDTRAEEAAVHFEDYLLACLEAKAWFRAHVPGSPPEVPSSGSESPAGDGSWHAPEPIRGPEDHLILRAWMALRSLHQPPAQSPSPASRQAARRLKWPLQQVLEQTGKGQQLAARQALLIQLLVHYGGMAPDAPLILTLLEDPDARVLCGVNQYKGVWYFSKEGFGELARWLFTLHAFSHFARQAESGPSTTHGPPPSGEKQGQAGGQDLLKEKIGEASSSLERLLELSGQSEYRLDRFRKALGDLRPSYS
jgi:glycosidase